MISGISKLGGSYLRPGEVLANKAASGFKESQLLGWLMLACLISFSARLPRLVGDHQGDTPLEAVAGANMVAALIFAPLFFYGLAAISHLVLRFFGGKATWQQARAALFWALFITQPLIIIMELLHYFGIPRTAMQIIPLISGLIFLYIWLTGLTAIEWPKSSKIA